MEPKIESKPALTVVGMKVWGDNAQGEIPALWREFVPRIDEIQNLTPAHDSYGVMDNYDKSSGHFDYVSAVEVSVVEKIPEGMMSWDIPAQKYAVLEFKFSAIRQAYRKIEAWISESGNRRVSGPEFEYYPPGFNPDDPAAPMYIYIE